MTGWTQGRKTMFVFTDASTNQTLGTSGIGFAVMDSKHKVIFSGSQALKCADNNSAELWAIAYCCQSLALSGFFKNEHDVDFFVDSQTALKAIRQSTPTDDLSLEALQVIDRHLFKNNTLGNITFYQACGHQRCDIPFIAKGNHKADQLALAARLEYENILETNTLRTPEEISLEIKKKRPKNAPFYLIENRDIRPTVPTKICSFHLAKDLYKYGGTLENMLQNDS